MDPITYAQSGVDVKRAESFVSRLKERAKRQGHGQLWPAAGGYAAVYPMGNDIAVAVTTDGVGTKLLVAHELKDHTRIGIDLVAMCANDLICVGARPTMFLDYFAVGKLDDRLADDVIVGIVEGCDQAGMILAGGETAEMPGVYDSGHYDLAGFSIGHVTKDSLITGAKIKPGQKLIGVASSGIHSNGLSLARKVLKPADPAYKELLVPTFIYVQAVLKVFSSFPQAVVGLIHVTGGGWRNMFRLNQGVGFRIDNPLPVPTVLHEISKHVQDQEMYTTFNMGMGLVLIADNNADAIVESFSSSGFVAQIVGEVTDQALTLALEPRGMVLHD